MSRSCLRLLALLGCLRVADAAVFQESEFAGSPVPIGAGPRALGMGGAFTAIADDATANTWNPAGMIQLERAELALSGGWYGERSDSSAGGSETASAVELDHASAVLPFFAFGLQQTVGLGWQRQFDFTRDIAVHEFFDDGFGFVFDHDMRLTQEGSFASTSASYACEPLPGLGLGVTGHLWADRWTGASAYEQRRTLDGTTSIFGTPIVDQADVYRRTEVEDGASVVLGAWWRALPSLTLGLTVKPEYTLGLHTRGVARQSQDGNPFPDTPIDSRSDLVYPTSATVGIAWRHRDAQTLALDVTWTNWSGYRAIDEDGATRSPVHPFIPPGDFADGWSVRLGYEYLLILPRSVLVGRVGLLYEGLPGATRVADATLAEQARATVDRYYGATAGVSLCLRRIIFDLGGQVRYGDDVGAGQHTAPDQTTDVVSTTLRFGVAYLF